MLRRIRRPARAYPNRRMPTGRARHAPHEAGYRAARAPIRGPDWPETGNAPFVM
jgi:hypothetical protein